jgi:hypothetical protein
MDSLLDSVRTKTRQATTMNTYTHTEHLTQLAAIIGSLLAAGILTAILAAHPRTPNRHTRRHHTDRANTGTKPTNHQKGPNQ